MMFPMGRQRQIRFLCAVLFSLVQGITAQCPPAGYDAVKPFDVERFVDERWYSLKQLPVVFQPEDQFNCVFADYSINSRKSLRCLVLGCSDPLAINVYNSARDGSTTGRVVSINFKATIPDPVSNPAKANIGARLQPNFTRKGTNYWVVAVGYFNELPGLASEPASEFYQYAIITAGPLKTASGGKCISSSGMWFFSRSSSPPVGTVAAMDAIATKLGIDVSVMKPVNQVGCPKDEGKAGIRGFIASIATVLEGVFT
jgi:lipocalin